MQQRLDDLVELDFIWDVCEYKWQQHFEALIDFYEQHGHVHVPDSYQSLGPWVKEQRREYRKIVKGQPSRLTPNHAMALNRIGIDWHRQSTVQRQNEASFQKHLEEYKEYISEHPDASVASMPMQHWVENQRKLYRAWLQGQQDMSQDRRQLLEEAGIVQGIQVTNYQ